MTPTTASYPGVLEEFLAQQDRLLAMIDQAAQADLQTMCWWHKGLPIRFNPGDYFNYFVSHDASQLDQAQRALNLYARQVAANPT